MGTTKVLENKVALVTGAGSGIGKAIAILYAREGAKVIVNDISEEKGQGVADHINSEGGEAFFIKADASKEEEVQELVRKTVEKYGKLDIACNNAGIGGEQNATGNYSIKGWNKVVEINLNGVFFGCKYQLEQMERWGRRHCEYGLHPRKRGSPYVLGLYRYQTCSCRPDKEHRCRICPEEYPL